MSNTTKNLQYQLSNGNWINCNYEDYDRTEEFLKLCEIHNNMNREQVLTALESGKTLRNDSMDWYSNCRYEPAPRPVVEVEMVKCSCGHKVPRGSVMNASRGTCCPDCYDRMSD